MTPSELDGTNEATCRGCGRKIVWATTSNDKKIPLDKVAPTYETHFDASGTLRATRTSALVSHFNTCPNAGDFSGRGKEASS